ncbi:uncharacterized protein Z519_12057 [Cladophialophora bantiana CBS 173.52]|uniref:WKF domain-containing protein n=1 Tax=Cladophialophora bantiana (strain ATCC 10958 / CBS 173.52 / CDC B-1940 / NIH 8579) TaxID=1442370 RepID=A0A0D2EBD0_CLAB1|nr:uncharacterized protein Z519_12057 [Cladophialophora bantiana CBS 173.52]KIW87421.1 hypothetical protein Z519_12057 [Cladophialophora bantiana CBS 173.52]
MSRPGIPAWKKLGLKLKYANENPERATSNGIASPAHQAGYDSLKDSQSSTSEPPRKKQKMDSKSKKAVESASANPDLQPETTKGREEPAGRKVEKRVSFSADAKPSSPTGSLSPVLNDFKAQKSSTSVKKSKKTGPNVLQQFVPKSTAVLEYLNQYHAARSEWKFNKNRETWILKHVFSESDIPQEYNLALGRYIYGLQGAGARERLKLQSIALLEKEERSHMEVDSRGNVADEEGDVEYRQRFKDDLASPPSSGIAAAGTLATDPKYQSWIQRQSRPRILLWALGLDSDALINGTKTKVKKRKNRTAVVDYFSSSSSSTSSSSDSDSDRDRDSGSESEESHKGSQGRIRTSKGDKSEETSSSGSDEDSSSESDSSTDVESAV